MPHKPEFCWIDRNGHEQCVPLLAALQPVKWGNLYIPDIPDLEEDRGPIPDPGPRKLPQPDPWLVSLGMREDLILEINVLAAATSLADRAGDSRVGNALRAAVKEEAAGLQGRMPKGTELRLAG